MQKKIESDLVALKGAFLDVELPWCLTDGIVLGYGRFGKVMPWDTDIDAGIFVEVDDEKWIELRNALHAHGFKIGQKKDDFIYGKRKVKLNLWLYHKTRWYYEAFPSTTPGLKFILRRKWFDELNQVQFLGSTFSMPNHLEDYLDCSYGKNWRTNIIKDHKKFSEQKRGKRGDLANWLKHSEEMGLWSLIKKV